MPVGEYAQRIACRPLATTGLALSRSPAAVPIVRGLATLEHLENPEGGCLLRIRWVSESVSLYAAYLFSFVLKHYW